jgi:hypothetical protein
MLGTGSPQRWTLFVNWSTICAHRAGTSEVDACNGDALSAVQGLVEIKSSKKGEFGILSKVQLPVQLACNGSASLCCVTLAGAEGKEVVTKVTLTNATKVIGNDIGMAKG